MSSQLCKCIIKGGKSLGSVELESDGNDIKSSTAERRIRAGKVNKESFLRKGKGRQREEIKEQGENRTEEDFYYQEERTNTRGQAIITCCLIQTQNNSRFESWQVEKELSNSGKGKSSR